MYEQINLLKDLRNIENQIAALGYLMSYYPMEVNQHQEGELTQLENKKNEIETELISAPDIQLVNEKKTSLIHQIMQVNNHLNLNANGLRISKSQGTVLGYWIYTYVANLILDCFYSYSGIYLIPGFYYEQGSNFKHERLKAFLSQKCSQLGNGSFKNLIELRGFINSAIIAGINDIRALDETEGQR